MTSRNGRLEPNTIVDRQVQFRIRDVYLPEPTELLMDLYGNATLQGRVLAISDSGAPNGLYAVVEIEQLDRPVIVPATLVTTSH